MRSFTKQDLVAESHFSKRRNFYSPHYASSYEWLTCTAFVVEMADWNFEKSHASHTKNSDCYILNLKQIAIPELNNAWNYIIYNAHGYNITDKDGSSAVLKL